MEPPPIRAANASAAALRRRAEASLQPPPPEGGLAQPEANAQRLLHELQVHQIELEMQNEELLQARDKLESEREKYSDLYDFAPVGYLTLDREGMVCEANLKAAALLGTDRSRLVRRRLGQFVAVADLPAFNGFLKKSFASQVLEVCELSLLTEGQAAVPVRLEAMVAASGCECRVVLQDISEHKRAEADRLILSKLESTGILAGGIAHDFNNLLTVIILNLELAKERVSPSAQDVRHRLDEALQAAATSRGLTQQLITFSKGGDPIRKPTALAGVIHESARLAVSGSQVRCELSVAEHLRRAEVDAGQIGQVIRNLVQNAREAMLDGGVVTLRAENLVLDGSNPLGLPAGDYVRISIADQGFGIAKDVLPKIFDPYFSTKQRGALKGMGLGLTVCHSIVQNHGGAIRVVSTVGVGTTFHVHLPAAQTVAPRAPAPAPAPPVPHRRGRILVMDDEEEVRKVLATTLEQLGHQVETAEHGQRAVDLYKRARELGRPFDAVILDLTVRGGLGGLETLPLLRTIAPALPAIVVSGYANHPVLLNYAGHGFNAALAKPFELGKLQAVVAQVLSPSQHQPVAP